MIFLAVYAYFMGDNASGEVLAAYIILHDIGLPN